MKSENKNNKLKLIYIISAGIIAIFVTILMHVYVKEAVKFSAERFVKDIEFLKDKNINIDISKSQDEIEYMLLAKIYWVRSFFKALAFLLPICIYFLLFRENPFWFLSFKNKINKKIIYFGILIIFLIFIGFNIVKPILNMDKIAEKVRFIAKTKLNYSFMFIYIMVFNALFEEMFFRGFLYLNLSKYIKEKWASVFSALCFGIYHAGMFKSLNIWVGILAVLGLTLIGYIFNTVNKKRRNIYSSYVLHSCANFAINTIGFLYIN